MIPELSIAYIKWSHGNSIQDYITFQQIMRDGFYVISFPGGDSFWFICIRWIKLVSLNSINKCEIIATVATSYSFKR